MAPIATLTVRLSAQIAEFQSEFRNATKATQEFQSNFEGIATRAAAVGSFIGGIATKIASSLASAFGQGIQDAIRLSSEFSNAFLGLGSVARAFGTDADAASAAARKLSADGLLPLKDSATGLKNLLASGFNLDQATRLMDAFKDSAAFGRQGALSFGDAIRSATEGVKNGNSILVDNAGVTKNLSQILKEAGFSAQDLSRASTDAGVRMALFNGILKETRAQTGDAAKLTQTYSGQVSRLEASYAALLVTIGSAITQNATVARTIGAIGDAFFSLNTSLVNNRKAFNLVSDGVIFLVRAVAELLNAADLVQTAFAGLQIASNRLFEAFANIGIAVFKMAEKAETLQKFLDPVAFQRHAAAANEARQAYTFLEGAAQGLRDASKDAADRSFLLGNTLQEVRAKASALATELEATRGKTVELGAAAGHAGSAIADGIGKGSAKAAAELKKLQKQIDASLSGKLKIGLTGAIPGFTIDLNKLATIIPLDIPKALGPSIRQGLDGLTKLPGVKIDLTKLLIPTAPQNFFERAFGGDFGGELSRTIIGALQGGGNVVKSAAGLIGQTITSGIAKTITSGAGLAISGALGGVINAILPGVGALLGPLADKIFGLFDRNKGRDAVKSFAESFGGFDALHKRLLELGSAGEDLWKRLTQGVGRNNPEQAAAAIDAINQALGDFGTEAERAAKRLDSLGRAVDGVNKKAALFASPFQALIDSRKDADANLDGIAAKLAETAQRGQAEFERLGVFVGATFAGLVKESGDAIGAIRSLAPSFAVLQKGVSEFGLTTSGTIEQLLGMFSLVNDAVTGPILESIQATGQIFTGLQGAGILTADLFQTVASDIGASFRDLEAKGGDVAKAMALSQPILQKLWEAQQTYGEITDETTLKILKQAEEQGLVGANMKDVNQKILDVLIAIADVFGAVLPESFRKAAEGSKQPAKDIEDNFKRAGRTVQDTFSGLKVDPIRIKIEYDDPGFPGGDGRQTVPALAGGGIVRRPTLALIGEAGPEAVVPLGQLGSRTGAPAASGQVIFQRGAFEGVVVDSNERVDQLAASIFKAVSRGGRLQTQAQRALGSV